MMQLRGGDEKPWRQCIRWRMVGRGFICELGGLHLGRILQLDTGWLVAPAGESSERVADQEAARARLLVLVESRARKFFATMSDPSARPRERERARRGFYT